MSYSSPKWDAAAGGKGLSRLSLTFAAGPGGKTFLARQFAQYPFHVCKVLYQDPLLPGMGTLYMQSSAGGLYEDDRQTIDVIAKAGAQAHVTTQASTIVHSMKGGTAARQYTRLRAEAGSLLEFLPDPQILFPDSRYEAKTTVTLEAGAVVIHCESFLNHDPNACGGVPFVYSSEINVEDTGGNTLAIDRMNADKQAFMAPAPGVMGAFRAYGTVLLLAPGQYLPLAPAQVLTTEQPAGALIAVTELPFAAGHVFRILAGDGVQLKAALAHCWSLSRLSLTGQSPSARRK